MTKCILNCPKRNNRGKAQWTIQSCILRSSHIMNLNSTKLVEIGQKIWKLVQTDRQRDRHAERQTDTHTDRQAFRFLYTSQKLCLGV